MWDVEGKLWVYILVYLGRGQLLVSYQCFCSTLYSIDYLLKYLTCLGVGEPLVHLNSGTKVPLVHFNSRERVREI